MILPPRQKPLQICGGGEGGGGGGVTSVIMTGFCSVRGAGLRGLLEPDWAGLVHSPATSPASPSPLAAPPPPPALGWPGLGLETRRHQGSGVCSS